MNAYDAQFNKGEPFGIEVHKAGERGTQDAAKEDWAVFWPHQCDSWMIACSPDRAFVLAEARRFRAELGAAIAVLAGTDSPGDPYETGYREGEANREADIRIAVEHSRTPEELLQSLRDMTGCQDMDLGDEYGD